ncbi:DUF4179 domain-containing protein [Paenibacillus sp. YPG26]|uniref:DUF4179 domain-containing protein n=1 Tax=Paenibacillus sp. YPG26 TaxID=2878915 RepID=UPI00203EE4D4|nr:DUF4179 domain-containing protein [Paenibacillus sp. YPG26]USB33537.1 DUF4179 domain-containing protein [Paenibacillus sp. YPG26]
MSLYDELNNVRIDVSVYEEEILTEMEQKRWEKRVLRKLPKRKSHSMIKWAGLAGALILAVSLIIPLSGTALAKMPLIYRLIESFIQVDNPPDLSNYKTAVGETAENSYGRMTLNEVLVDTDRVLISATLEPIKGVNMDEVSTLSPSILVNGEEAPHPFSSQSFGEENNGTYTITGDVPLNTLPHTPKGNQLQIKISYTIDSKRVVLDKPWVFDVNVSTQQMQKDTVTYELNKPLPLKHGGTVTINKVVSSPVSTILYYDVSQAELGSFWIRLVSKGGKIKELQYYESIFSGERTYHRYGPLDLKKETYWIVAEDKNGKEISPRVPIK